MEEENPVAAFLEGLFQDKEGFSSEDDEQISKVSFGTIGLISGTALLAYGFGAYFGFLPGNAASGVMLIYGFPATLLGFAFKYAELKPVPCKSAAEAVRLRASQMTDIQKQVREDVTRYRYGDEQHLDLAMERIFKIGRGGGIPRKYCPLLTGVREEVTDGSYTLVLEFADKPQVLEGKMDIWADKAEKFASFFGPGISATLAATDTGHDMALISDGSGAGMGGGGKQEVLPPLMPGMPTRRAE